MTRPDVTSPRIRKVMPVGKPMLAREVVELMPGINDRTVRNVLRRMAEKGELLHGFAPPPPHGGPARNVYTRIRHHQTGKLL